mmetsp:Transcript_32931/g.75838  ORF Transcript_32931/g.75838 Transcript_32931/m.75838 type:complete len:252 (+) Transcript_32931:232-987(+)
MQNKNNQGLCLSTKCIGILVDGYIYADPGSIPFGYALKSTPALKQLFDLPVGQWILVIECTVLGKVPSKGPGHLSLVDGSSPLQSLVGKFGKFLRQLNSPLEFPSRGGSFPNGTPSQFQHAGRDECHDGQLQGVIGTSISQENHESIDGISQYQKENGHDGQDSTGYGSPKPIVAILEPRFVLGIVEKIGHPRDHGVGLRPTRQQVECDTPDRAGQEILWISKEEGTLVGNVRHVGVLLGTGLFHLGLSGL